MPGSSISPSDLFRVIFFVVKDEITGHLNLPLLKLKGACLVFLICIDLVLDEEVFILIEERRLLGKGLGFIDMHLIASALIHHVPILTRDKSLKRVTVELGIAF